MHSRMGARRFALAGLRHALAVLHARSGESGPDGGMHNQMASAEGAHPACALRWLLVLSMQARVSDVHFPHPACFGYAFPASCVFRMCISRIRRVLDMRF